MEENNEQLNRIENMIKDYIEKHNQNTLNLGKLQEKQDFYDKDWERNWKQHEEFYSKINNLESENDKVSGGIKVLGALLVPIIISVIIALIKSFIG